MNNTFYRISEEIEANTFTGEPEEVTLYGINSNYGYFELEAKNTPICGVVTVQGSEPEIIEEIYKALDTGDFELYLDKSGAYPYIDITTWRSHEDLEEIKNKVLDILGVAPELRG